MRTEATWFTDETLYRAGLSIGVLVRFDHGCGNYLALRTSVRRVCASDADMWRATSSVTDTCVLVGRTPPTYPSPLPVCEESDPVLTPSCVRWIAWAASAPLVKHVGDWVQGSVCSKNIIPF